MGSKIKLSGLKSCFRWLAVPQFPHLKSRCNGIIVGFKEELLHTMADTWYTYIMFLITISPADFIPYNIMNMFLWYDEQTKVWNCRIIVIQCIVSTSRLCFKCWSSIVSCDLVNSLPRSFICSSSIFEFFKQCAHTKWQDSPFKGKCTKPSLLK